MTLHELSLKYGSDKAEHGYCEFYEKQLPDRDTKIKLLEIGVKEGASLKMWAEWFPNGEIWGLDLFQENRIEDIRADILSIESPDGAYVLKQGHQCDWQLLEQLRKQNFDVIIDDGSHNARDQMMTFFGLYAGGGQQYYIEDLHCNKDEFYSQGLPFVATADQVFKRIVAGNMVEEMKDEEDNNYFPDAKLWPNVSHKNIILITNK